MIIKNLLKEFLCVGLVVTSILGTSISLQARSNKEGTSQSKSTNTYYPNVQSYEKKDNKTFKIGEYSRLYVIKTEKTDHNDVLLKDMKLMSSYFLDKNLLSKAPDIVFGDEENTVSNDIVIKMENVPELAGKEQSYKIDITDKIVVIAKDEVGIYYGLISVIQMLQANDKTLEQGTILDYPDVKERSLHLDAARKFFTKDWIISLIKDLSWQKYNSLQFHFSENEGFRLQSDTLDKINFQYDGSNYLSKQDMLDIIQVANEYHIELIPSLDSPGHLGKVLSYLPEDYSCAKLFPTDDRKRQCFNIFTNPEAKKFLTELMTEYIDFFSKAGCKHFNIGGDEFLAHFESFSTEQYCQLIEYFNEISAIVKDHGMTPRAWNDGLLYGNHTGYKLDSDIEICYWAAPKNTATIQDFIDNGNKVINYSDKYMYYVLSPWWQQNACPEGDVVFREWDPGKFSTLPTGPQIFEKPYSDSVIGGSFAIWCDLPLYETQDAISRKIFHRTRATAYKMWNAPKELPSYNNVKNAFDKIGRVPGFEKELVEPGNVYKNNESVAVTLKYVDQKTQKEIAPSESYYGLKGETYSFETKDIYGYKYLNASSELQGTYDKNLVITFNYELHCNKDDLQKALDSKLVEKEYIAETYADYKQAYTTATQVNKNELATQLEVDQATKVLNDAKTIVVKKEFFPLYVEVTYPLNNIGYVSGYNEYKAVVNTAKKVLYTEGFNKEKMQEQMNALNTAKDNLVKAHEIRPTVNAPIGGYGGNRPENMVDGNRNTKYWSNGYPEENQSILFTFPKEVDLKGIEIVYPSNITLPTHDNIKGADIQISLDGNEWKTIGKMTENDFTKKFTFDSTKAKYARIHFTKTSGAWLQLAEVVFDIEIKAEDNSLKDLISRAETIDLSGRNDAVVDTFIQALIDAQKVNATGTTDIHEAKDNLEKAMTDLEKPVIEETKVIFSIDAGRKYFSKDQIKQIIKKAHDCGYTDVELILGNDGLRFALDDMTLTVNGKTYASADVKKAITAGNNAYYKDPNGDYLTETEMDEILAYAKKLNIGIIPVINSPGHMDAMLVAMQTLGIQNPMFQNSKRTVDLNNEEAIAFNKEMIKKYATYFAKQSKIFNFGCDEYANDVDTGGWAKLQKRGDYPKFVAYVNDLAKIIKDAGMKPMCFNDGIYYNSKDNYGTFDQDIIISYWTAGWIGFNVANVNYLYNKGHKIINTNDGWYWVLGNLGNSGYNFNKAMRNIKSKPFNQIVGDRKNTPSIGSMQAVWCDDPSQAHDMPRIMELMDAFSNKHSDVTVKYANYDAVDKAIGKVPADTSVYTKESVDALNKALADVDWTLKADQQARVDAMAKAIEDAIAGLQVNKDELIAEIAKEPKEDWKYTSASWKAYQTALKNAKKVANDDKATPTQVKEATKALQEAYKGLVENEELTPITPSINKGALKEAINQKPKYEEEAYTKASWKAYEEALEKANKVLANEKATQKEIDDATKALQEAYKGLVENEELTPITPSIKKGALKEAINQKPKYEEEAYTKASWKAYQEALEKANKVLANEKATQKEIDDATKALKEAYAKLQENPGLTPIGPSEQVIPMTPLKPSTPVDSTETEKPSTTDKVENGEKPNTGVSTNAALLWSVLLGAGVVVLATVKHRKNQA